MSRRTVEYYTGVYKEEIKRYLYFVHVLMMESIKLEKQLAEDIVAVKAACESVLQAHDKAQICKRLKEADADTDAIADTNADTIDDTNADTIGDTNADTVNVADTGADTNADTIDDINADIIADIVNVADTINVADTNADTNADTIDDTNAGTIADTVNVADTVADTNADTIDDTNADITADIVNVADTNADTNADTIDDANADTIADTNAVNVADTINADTVPDANANTIADTNAGAITDADVNANSNHNADSSASADSVLGLTVGTGHDGDNQDNRNTLPIDADCSAPISGAGPSVNVVSAKIVSIPDANGPGGSSFLARLRAGPIGKLLPFGAGRARAQQHNNHDASPDTGYPIDNGASASASKGCDTGDGHWVYPTDNVGSGTPISHGGRSNRRVYPTDIDSGCDNAKGGTSADSTPGLSVSKGRDPANSSCGGRKKHRIYPVEGNSSTATSDTCAESTHVSVSKGAAKGCGPMTPTTEVIDRNHNCNIYI